MILQISTAMSIKSELKKKIKLQKHSDSTERELILSRLAQFLENNKQELAEYSKPFILDYYQKDPETYASLFLNGENFDCSTLTFDEIDELDEVVLRPDEVDCSTLIFDEAALMSDTEHLFKDLLSQVRDLSIEKLRSICTEEEYWKRWKSQFVIP
jgi:hypothetical protein